MEKLMRAGLIKRIDDKYHPTSFGMVFLVRTQGLKPQLNIFGNSKQLTQS
jgi:predicted transcriptional regulator